jgi:hypothetical protein
LSIVKGLRQFSILILLLCWIGRGACLCLALPAAAANVEPGDQFLFVETQDSQEAAQNSSPNPPADKKPEEKSEKKKDEKDNDKEKKKSDHSGAFVAAPLPIVSPALGAGIVPVLGYITPIPAKDRELTPSVIGAGGLITNDGTRGFGLGADLYLDKDRYEVESVYAHGNLDYNLYGVGFVNGNAGFKLPLEQAGHLFFFKTLRHIGWDFYAGIRFIDGSSFITLKPTSDQTPPIPPDVGLRTDLRALGMEIWRDSRPNRFYPLKGSVIDFTGDFFGKDLGSKYSFQSYKFTFNKYWSLTDKQVLAYNFYWCGTGGSPPFYGNCIYGANNELRGYTAGRYLDRYMFATQLEYRLVLPWRFGLVGFGGVGSVMRGGNQLRLNQFLPAGGTGIRYMLSKKYHVNLRTDFAWGKDNFTWSVGVGEAF